MMNIETWLAQATRCLSSESAAQVRKEIAEHYTLAREQALARGAVDAEGEALAALGDPGSANRGYRKVLLTRSEAALLRESNWEARAVCSRPWLKRLLRSLAPALLCAAGVAFAVERGELGRVLLAAALMTGMFFTVPLLPGLRTRAGGRLHRWGKWVVLAAAIALLGRPLELSWLWLNSLGWIAAMDWTRHAIRRKLPVSAWPRQLYF